MTRRKRPVWLAGYPLPMRHVAFLAVLGLYIVVVGQNWAVYTSALMLALWVRQKGDLDSVPFTIGKTREPVEITEEPHR